MVGSIVSVPPLEAAVIVPLLVRDIAVNVEIAAGSRLRDGALIDDAVACGAAGIDLRVAALVDGDARAQGQNGPRAGQVIFAEKAVSRRAAEIDRRVVERLRVVKIKRAVIASVVDCPRAVPAALFTTVPPARSTEAWTRQIERAVVGHAAQRTA